MESYCQSREPYASFFLSIPVHSQDMESRALVVASQEAVLSSELAARIKNIAVKEMQRFKF